MNIPCKDPENDPDDWFIGINGKQYSDDEVLSLEERQEILAELNNESDLTTEERAELAIPLLEAAWDAKKKLALQRRRRARDACFSCNLRTHCLDIAIQQAIPHGTWGGYFEEQIRELRREMNRRRKRTL